MNNDDPPCFTWRRLRESIDAMPPGRLDDPVQFIPPSCHEEPIPLGSVIGMNTVGYYSTCTRDDGAEYQIENYTRGVIDNNHHAEHFVLLTDGNPFSKDGDSYYTMNDEGFFISNKTRKAVWRTPFTDGGD